MAVFAALKVKSWIKDVTDMKNCKNRLVLLLIVLLLFREPFLAEIAVRL